MHTTINGNEIALIIDDPIYLFIVQTGSSNNSNSNNCSMVYVPKVWEQLVPSAKQKLQWLVINRTMMSTYN